jgi:hypothetical protein
MRPGSPPLTDGICITSAAAAATRRDTVAVANVVSCLGLFVALGSSAVAASPLSKNSVGTKQLKKNAVTTAKIKKEAVTAAKVKNGTMTGRRSLQGLGGSRTETVSFQLPPGYRPGSGKLVKIPVYCVSGTCSAPGIGVARIPWTGGVSGI